MDATRHPPIPALSENDLRLLRIFRVVAESGGVTAAERRLHMERSTISRHIKALEQRLGGCLCLRGPSGFELTDFGETVLAAARRAGEMLDAVRDDLNRARNVLTGDLHVGLADNCLGNPACRMAEAIARMGREAPGVRIHLTVRPPADLARELAARRLHLCVAGAPGGEAEFVRHELLGEEFRVYARRCSEPGRPRLSDLFAQGYGLVMRRGEIHSERLAARFPRIARSEASGLEAVAMLLASGRHLGLLPVHYAAMIAPFCPLEEVEEADRMRYVSAFHLTHEADRPLSAPGRLFRDIVIEAHRPTAGPEGLSTATGPCPRMARDAQGIGIGFSSVNPP